MTDHASKFKGLLWVGSAFLIAAAFAVGLAPLARAVPFRWEKSLASSFDFLDADKECRSTLKNRELLDKFVGRLYPVFDDDASFSIDVRIVKDQAINAYAGLGGHITVNSGLLKAAGSADEVAGVLAHEIEHVHHRHIIQNAALRLLTAKAVETVAGGSGTGGKLVNMFLTMSFSRDQEAEADEDGLRRLQKAHIDTKGFKNFIERLEDMPAAPQFLSDHPSPSSRAAMAEKFRTDQPRPVLSAEEWTKFKNFCN